MSNKSNFFIPALLILLLTGCSPTLNMPSTENPLPECPSSPNCKRVSVTIESDSISVFNAFEEALTLMNAETITPNQADKRIDAIFRIPVFGYRDDVAISIKAEGNSSKVYIRSASREGYWDIGVNSIRVNRLIRNVKNNLSK